MLNLNKTSHCRPKAELLEYPKSGEMLRAWARNKCQQSSWWRNEENSWASLGYITFMEAASIDPTASSHQQLTTVCPPPIGKFSHKSTWKDVTVIKRDLQSMWVSASGSGRSFRSSFNRYWFFFIRVCEQDRQGWYVTLLENPEWVPAATMTAKTTFRASTDYAQALTVPDSSAKNSSVWRQMSLISIVPLEVLPSCQTGRLVST